MSKQMVGVNKNNMAEVPVGRTDPANGMGEGGGGGGGGLGRADGRVKTPAV